MSTARVYENASAVPPVFTGFLDRRELLAFGQAVAYRLFAAKCYVVMPITISDEDLSRLEALCMLFGVGLVVFSLDPRSPDFAIRVRAQKYSPDMFYVNEFASRLHQYNPGLFEDLFS